VRSNKTFGFLIEISYGQFGPEGPQLSGAAKRDAVFIRDADDETALAPRHIADAAFGLPAPRKWITGLSNVAHVLSPQIIARPTRAVQSFAVRRGKLHLARSPSQMTANALFRGFFDYSLAIRKIAWR
jgi:hypothetical protein